MSDFPRREIDRSIGRRAIAAVGLAVALLCTVLAGGAAALEASNNPALDSTADYAAYPTNLPDTCPDAVNGVGVLEGLTFTAQGATVTNLRDFEGLLEAGDPIVMAWTGWTPGCETLISLSVKRAPGPVFDATANQSLVDWVGCDGPNDTICQVDGGFAITLTMPSADILCGYQVDAVTGPPLDVVGPDGSYYSDSIRQNGGDNMLISAANGGYAEPCGAPVVADPVCAATGAALSIASNDYFDETTADVFLGDGGDLAAGDALVAADVVLPARPDGGSAIPVDVTVPMTPGQSATITVVIGETVISLPFTFDCNEPAVTGPACAEGGLALELSNHGIAPATFVVTIDGAAQQFVLGDGDTQTVPVTVAEGDTVDIEVTADGVSLLSVDDLLVDCVHPAAVVVPTCTAGNSGAAITLTNPGEGGLDAVFTITVDGVQFGGTVTVPADGSAQVTVPVAEADTVHLVISEASEAEPLVDQAFTADCVNPTVASTVVECGQNGLVVTLTNPGGDTDAVYTVTVDGSPFGGPVVVPGDGSQTVIIPIAEDQTVGVRITEASQTAAVLEGPFKLNCVDPIATATVVCAQNGVVVTLTNPAGTEPATFTVTAGGSPVATGVIVPGGQSTTVVVPLAEGASSRIVVTEASAAATVLDSSFTRTCTDVLPNTITQGTTQLPRTGAESGGLLALALGLVLVGAGVVLVSTDRRQVVTARQG